MPNNKRIFIAIGVTILLVVGGVGLSLTKDGATETVTSNQNIIKFDDDENEVKDPVEKAIEEPSLTLAEVTKHDNRADCWMIIRDKVYDVSVSKFQDHPGGEPIFEGCGIDATVLFETRPMGTGTPHSALSIEKILPTFYIGDLEK